MTWKNLDNKPLNEIWMSRIVSYNTFATYRYEAYQEYC